MAIKTKINNITGQTPFNIYICQGDGSDCFYINTVSSFPYEFDIPVPYDNSSSYVIKVLDNNKCLITGFTNVV